MAAEKKYRLRKTAAATATEAAPKVHVPRLFPWIVGLITFLIYMLTMTPGMQMGDGTELAAAAYVLGVPHPTGYPLYMILCKVWLLITFVGDPIVRTTLLNGLLMSAAVGITALILVDLLRYFWQTAADKAMLIWAAAGALTLGFLRFHWSNAVVTEVYALEFLIMVIFTRIAQKIDLHGSIHRGHLIGLTACLALGLAHHRLSITMILPAVAIWWLGWKAAKSSSIKLPWLAAILILTIGAAFYLYIPLRAAANPPINWGDADNFSRFYNHVRGTEYLDRGLLKPGLGQSFSGAALAAFGQLQSAHLLTDIVGQFIPVRETIQAPPGTQKVFITSNGLVILTGLFLCMLAFWGAWRTWAARQKFLAAVLLAVALQNVFILFVYNIADIRDYFLYPFWALWVGLFALAAWLATRLSVDRRLIASYVMLLIPLGVFAANWSRCNRNTDIAAEELSAMILPETTEVVPQGSILITDDDSETFTTWYRQFVRNERTDVFNFGGNFIYMPWYGAFFTEAQRKEYQIKLAGGVATSAEEYTQQLRDGIIDANVTKRPVFTSINDYAVLQLLSKDYAVDPVAAAEVINRGLFDEATTRVLYRISIKDQAQ